MRYISFLRAINVGGHVVKMAELKAIFGSAGLSEVETFIASGNVILTSMGKPLALERKIEKALFGTLGYTVDTFLRTADEIREVAECAPFTAGRIDSAGAFNVAFTRAPLTVEQQRLLAQFDSDLDSFATVGREIYWLSRAKQSESKFLSSKMERLLDLRVTWRNINTVRRLSAKYPPARYNGTGR